MKIAIVGATGFIGSKLLDEAVSRGHIVTAITRSPDKLPKNDHIIPAPADVNDVPALTGYFRRQDAVIHSYAPGRGLGAPGRSPSSRQPKRPALNAFSRSAARAASK
jgi:uncharacterized protein